MRNPPEASQEDRMLQTKRNMRHIGGTKAESEALWPCTCSSGGMKIGSGSFKEKPSNPWFLGGGIVVGVGGGSTDVVDG